MKCRPCHRVMRFIYDPSGRVIIGHECQECGATSWTWDAGIAFPPPTGERRYTPYDPATEGPLPELAPPVVAQPTRKGKQREPIRCAWEQCGEWFVPGVKQEYHTEACRGAARRERAQYQTTKRGVHDDPEFSAGAQ